MDLRFDMHRAGINMRHLGLIRSFFWFKLKGTVNLTFNSKFVETSTDMSNDIKKGGLILVYWPEEECDSDL